MHNPLAPDLEHILAHTQGVWEPLRGEQLFITGGTGFFGCWLLESLLWAQDTLGLHTRVTVLTRNPAAFQRKAPHLAHHPAVSLWPGDVLSFDFPPGDFPVILHAAAEVNPAPARQEFETIVGGTQRVLAFARQCRAQKLLFVSSGAVYGPQPDSLTHIPEDFNGRPASAYGEGKRAAEAVCAAAAAETDLQVKIARCFAFVGPYLPLDGPFAIGNFLRDALRGGPVVVQSDGQSVRSYLYAADLAIWLWTILARGKPGQAYNVGSPCALRIAELAAQVSRLADPPLPISLQPPEPPSSAARRYVPAVDKAEKELNLAVWVGLMEGLQKTMQWHQNFSPGSSL
jgi:nucleoside-diphosphate-sugar epimerase